MKHVRLPLTSREFLMTHVDSENLVRENTECKELLLEAMRYHLMPEQRSSLTTIRTTSRYEPTFFKAEKILKGSLDYIPSPSPSVKIRIIGRKVYLR